MGDQLKDTAPKKSDQTTDPQTPVKDGEPQDTPTGEELPEEYKGKSPEELVKIIRDKEAFIGTQTQEVGDLRGRMEQMEQEQRRFEQPADQPIAQPPEQPEYDDEDYVPMKAVKKMMNDADMKQQWQSGFEGATRAREEARRVHPELFKEIGGDVDKIIWQQFQGGTMHPKAMATEKAWEKAAIFMLHEKDPAKLVQILQSGKAGVTTPIPTTPVSSEVPGAGTPPTTETEPFIDLDDLGKEFMAHRPEGMSEEEFLKRTRENAKKRSR